MLLVVLLAGCTAETPDPNPLFVLDGTWAGQIKALRAPGISPKAMDYDLWLTIRGGEADVWFKYEGKWNRLWDGDPRLSVVQHKSNAVISASHSKPSVECHWVETWNFTVSQFRAGELETYWYRIVNNTGCPQVQGTQYAYGAIGRLRRVSTDVQQPRDGAN